jgi:hypothetical protein
MRAHATAKPCVCLSYWRAQSMKVVTAAVSFAVRVYAVSVVPVIVGAFTGADFGGADLDGAVAGSGAAGAGVLFVAFICLYLSFRLNPTGAVAEKFRKWIRAEYRQDATILAKIPANCFGAVQRRFTRYRTRKSQIDPSSEGLEPQCST